MRYFNLGFYLCDTKGFLQFMNLVKIALNVIRFVIPIILILMIMKDLYYNIINVNDKEGVVKIRNRIIASVIVFLVPTIVGVAFQLIGYIESNKKDSMDYRTSKCYTNANSDCLQKIDDYLNCSDILDPTQIANCKMFRTCNEYTLDDNCMIITKLNDGACQFNKTDGNYNTDYTRFATGEN